MKKDAHGKLKVFSMGIFIWAPGSVCCAVPNPFYRHCAGPVLKFSLPIDDYAFKSILSRIPER